MGWQKQNYYRARWFVGWLSMLCSAWVRYLCVFLLKFPFRAAAFCRACPLETCHVYDPVLRTAKSIGRMTASRQTASRCLEPHYSVLFHQPVSWIRDMSGDFNVQRQCQTCLAVFSTSQKLHAHLDAYRVRISPSFVWSFLSTHLNLDRRTHVICATREMSHTCDGTCSLGTHTLYR